MKRIGYIGYGRLGKQLAALIESSLREQPHEAFYFDAVFEGAKHERHFALEAFTESRFADLDFYVGLGYRQLPLKQALLKKLVSLKRSVPSFIHPSSHVDPSARIGQGCFVFPMCHVGPEVTLEDGVLLNCSVTLAHNITVGEATYLSPGVVVSGEVVIGRRTFIGTGGLVANDLEIGEDAVLGIGSVVTKSLPPRTQAIGNPLRHCRFKIS